MPHCSYKPAFPLSQYVERIWWVQNTGVPASRRRVYPSGGAMALVIHLKKPTVTYYIDEEPLTVRVPLLAGPYSRSFHVDPSQSTAVVTVVFRPGAARMFFPVAAHELHNTDIALREIHPGEADRLLNEVCDTSDEQELFLTVERYLYRKLKNAAPMHPAVSYAVEQLSGGGAERSIRRIQLEADLSHTRLIQLFREHVGLTPKLFYRVRRFRTLLETQQKNGMLLEGERRRVDVMVKNSSLYGSTGGWRFERFLSSAPAQDAVQDSGAACFACHSKVKAHGFVFRELH
jgi:uncharacterized protein DUF6597/cytochrome P460